MESWCLKLVHSYLFAPNFRAAWWWWSGERIRERKKKRKRERERARFALVKPSLAKWNKGSKWGTKAEKENEKEKEWVKLAHLHIACFPDAIEATGNDLEATLSILVTSQRQAEASSKKEDKKAESQPRVKYIVWGWRLSYNRLQ